MGKRFSLFKIISNIFDNFKGLNEAFVRHRVDSEGINPNCEIDNVQPEPISEINKYKILLDGPFEGSYSLAIVNREMARALKRIGHTVAVQFEGYGFYEPPEEFLRSNKDIADMYMFSKSMPIEEFDFESKFNYPPCVENMKSKLNVLHNYAWEESGFPQPFIENFNKYLSGITCISEHVKKIMIDNGISVPIFVSGCGTDHFERITEDKEYKVNAKRFKFLHISSCFPRKGVDILLRSFGMAFSSKDDVSLIIKTFDNPHNEIDQMLEFYKKTIPDYPDVVVIKGELTDEQIKALYKQCDVFVEPSKAEGFGLPMAEAMLCGIPVITTNWGGQLDFCNRENSWLVDYDFEYAKTHFNIFNSVWARPNESDLTFTLRQAFLSEKSERDKMAECGRRLLLEKFRWDDAAIRFTEQIDAVIKKEKEDLDLKMGIITTWNTKCGIAKYSYNLVSNMSNPDSVTIFAPCNQEIISNDGPNVKRLWEAGDLPSDLMGVFDYLVDNGLNLVVVQFQYGFFDLIELSEFILRCKYQGITVVIIMHSTINSIYKFDYIKKSLSVCDRILVHSATDLNNLKKVGIIENVAIFPHGINLQESAKTTNKTEDIPTIATFGFCFPHKGILELIDAVQILSLRGVRVKLMLLNAEQPTDRSHCYAEDIRNRIKECGLGEYIYFNSDFLDEEELSGLLRRANLVTFCYQKTDESTSAAARYGISTGLPVIVTPAKIFDELRDCVFRFEGFGADDIANGIEKVINFTYNDSDELEYVLGTARNWMNQSDFKKVGIRLENMCKSLHINRDGKTPDSIVEVPDPKGAINTVREQESDAIEVGSLDSFELFIEISNQSYSDWLCNGIRPVNISYHWFDIDGKLIALDGLRTPVRESIIKRGSCFRTSAKVRAPETEGKYTLEITLVNEGVFWFEEKGFKSKKLNVSVIKK